MRNRNTLFVAVLILALVASTASAIIVATSAQDHTTVVINGVGGGTSGTSATNGSQTTGSTGSGGGGVGGGGNGGGTGSAGQTQGVSGSTIVVGGIFSESGGIDSTVEEDTVRACFDAANAHGGVNGRRLQLVSYDDGLNGDTAYQEAVRLDQQDHIFAVVGWLAPFGEAKAAPYFEQRGIPIVGGLGVPQEFGSAVSFPVSPIFQVDGYALGKFATNGGGPLHFKHPGVFLVQTAGIENVAQGIINGAAANGVKINSNDIIEVPFANPNFSSYLLQFQQEGVDGLITQLDPFTYARLYDSMEQTNHIFPHLAGAGIDKQSVDQAIGQPLVGVYSFMPYLEAQGNPAGNAEINAYLGAMHTYYPSQVPNIDAFAEGSWASCQVFLQALSSIGQNVTRQALVQALDGQTFAIGGMAPPLNYGRVGSSHAAAHCASYIMYTSAHRWSILSQGGSAFICY